MRVRTIDSISELQSHLGLPRPGLLLEADLDRIEAPDDRPESRRRDAEILCTLAANVSGDCLDLGSAEARGAFRFASNLEDRGRVFTLRSTNAKLPDFDGSPDLQEAITNAIHPFDANREWNDVVLALVDPAETDVLETLNHLAEKSLTVWCGFDPADAEWIPAQWRTDATEWLHVAGSSLAVARPSNSSDPRAAPAVSWPTGVIAGSRRPGSARGQVSVILPNYNHGRYLPQAVESAVRQSVAPIEVLVMEHGSTDDSPEVLKRLAKKYPLLRWESFSRERHFMEHVNDLAATAAGEFLYFAAADDFALPGLIERSLSVLTRHPKAGFSAAPVLLADPESNLGEPYPAPQPAAEPAYISPDRNLALLRENLGGWAMGNSSLMRRSVLLEAGPFDPSLGSFCDGFLRMAIGQRWGGCYLPEPLAAWRKLADGYASSTEQDDQKLLSCYRRARELMQTRYDGWFPSDFIDLFTSRLISPLEQQPPTEAGS